MAKVISKSGAAQFKFIPSKINTGNDFSHVNTKSQTTDFIRINSSYARSLINSITRSSVVYPAITSATDLALICGVWCSIVRLLCAGIPVY